MPPAALAIDEVRHLTRRLAFTSTPPLERELRGMSPGNAVARLVAAARTSPQPPPDVAQGVWRNAALRYEDTSPQELASLRAAEIAASRRDIERLRHWWIREIVTSRAALRENLVLFFHGVFGSAASVVTMAQALYGCNSLLRESALGTIPSLLERLVLDPAMMIQIGMDEHRRERVSDRPAKLVLDHWTVGAGNYTDGDVEQLSRALTGWVLVAPPGQEPTRPVHADAERVARRTGLVPRFDEREFDAGEKTILGTTAAFDARAAIRHLALQPATARRYSGLLLHHFAVPDPGKRLAQQLAGVYVQTGGSIEQMLVSMAASAEFWSDASRWALIKSPVHLAAAACRQLEIAQPPVEAIGAWLGTVGQTLFDTPNSGEGGWPGQEAWLSPPERLAIRYQLPSVLAGRLPRLGLQPHAPGPPAAGAGAIPIGQGLRRASAAAILERLDPAPGFDSTGIPDALLVERVMGSANYQLA